jgi:hypothetical protein
MNEGRSGLHLNLPVRQLTEHRTPVIEIKARLAHILRVAQGLAFDPETCHARSIRPPTESTTRLQVWGLQVPHRETRLEHHMGSYPVTIEMSFAVVQHSTNVLTPINSKCCARMNEHSPIARALGATDEGVKTGCHVAPD